jgi:hypothetical protein
MLVVKSYSSSSLGAEIASFFMGGSLSAWGQRRRGTAYALLLLLARALDHHAEGVLALLRVEERMLALTDAATVEALQADQDAGGVILLLARKVEARTWPSKQRVHSSLLSAYARTQ